MPEGHWPWRWPKVCMNLPRSGLVFQAKPLEEGTGSVNRLNTVLTQLHKEEENNHSHSQNSNCQSSLFLFFDLVRVFEKIVERLFMFFCHFFDYKRCFKFCDITYVLYAVYPEVDIGQPVGYDNISTLVDFVAALFRHKIFQ